MPQRRIDGSGVIRLDGSIITYTSPHDRSFAIPVSEVAAVGEFTTDSGPFVPLLQ